MTAVEITYLTILSIGLILIIKSAVACYWQCKVIEAITAYSIDQIKYGLYAESKVYFDDIETLEATTFRIWDWGYKHILPKEKFELIKPYMKKRRNKI